ncbi:MAG: dienelactone hydrolase family protein [Hyphomicrobiaceae bacterium]
MPMPLSQDIINLYDAFTHGQITRRAFLERLTLLAGGAAAASALLGVLANDYARAALVAEDDPRLATASQAYSSLDGDVRAYLVWSKEGAKRPAVIVIHENRGLNPHIKDVARRIALEGFIAIAPDVLTKEGGTPEDEDKARDLIGKLDAKAAIVRLVGAVDFARSIPESTGKTGAVGFCWGGGMVNQLAAHAEHLDAGVAYYGRQLSADRVPDIKAKLMLHYAGKDERINAGIADYETALKAAGKSYELHMYEGAQHAFNNDTNAARYDKAAAELAWGRTVTFLKNNLG